MTPEQRKLWLQQRATGIGGSDVPIIFGLSTFKTPFELWQEKTGAIELEEVSSPEINRGNTMEPLIAEMYTQITNRMVRPVRGYQQHPDYPFMQGNPDRWVYANSDEPELLKLGKGILEIKSPNLGPFGKMVRENKPRTKDVLQLHHYMMVTDRQWGAIVCHNSERWQLIHWTVMRDEQLCNQILDACTKFWDCVQNNVAPEGPEIDETKFPDIDADARVETIDTPEWQSIAEEYIEAKALFDEAETMLKIAKLGITEAMGDYNAVQGHGIRAYNKMQSGRVTVDTKRLKAEAPKIYEKYKKIGKPFNTLKIYEINED